jgi:hypothetical protein
MGIFGDFVDYVERSARKASEVLGLPPKAEPEPEQLGSTTSDGPHEPYTQANKPSTSSKDLTPPPEIPEIGGDYSGVRGPDFGPWPPVGEDTPPPRQAMRQAMATVSPTSTETALTWMATASPTR